MANNDKAGAIAYDAYQMFSGKPRDIFVGSPLEMYSFDRPSVSFWTGFAEECLDRGLSEEQVRWLLQSKMMRHMFDSHDEKLIKLGRSMVENSHIQNTLRDFEK